MLALSYVLVLAVVALLVPLALNTQQRVDDETRMQASNSAAVVADASRVALTTESPSSSFFGAVIKSAAEVTRGRVVVVDGHGRLVADSERATIPRNQDWTSRPEIAAALGGHQVQSARESATLKRELLATAVPVVNNGRTIGAVRVTQDVEDVNHAVRRSFVGLGLVGISVLIAGLLIGSLMARQIAQPLARFEATARRVAEGDLDAQASIEGSAEQRSLGHTFNDMTSRLSRALGSQRQFVADASHQLRTPLAGLRLRVEEADARAGDPEVRRELKGAMNEIDRLARTVDELLVLSRAGERDGPGELLDLAEIGERLVERWQTYATAHDRPLTLDVQNSGQVFGSHADIDRALDALVENALQYTPPGSSTAVIVGGNGIAVRDQGPGLKEDEGEELFDRFRRGDVGLATAPGTGLGLAIARELVSRWGAEVTLRNASTVGTIATLRFAENLNQEAPDET